ncbi:MAG: hypothetical protein FWF08_00810 [Oscillospiraceae bacterium]|nr:hypothetical protein [Oscillospiraceae bacterium]
MKKQILTAISAILCLAMLFAANSCNMFNTEVEETTTVPSVTPMGNEDKEAIADYLNAMITKALAENPAISWRNEISIDNIKFVSAADDEELKGLNDASGQLRNLFTQDLKFKNGSSAYGEDEISVSGSGDEEAKKVKLNEVLWDSALTYTERMIEVTDKDEDGLEFKKMVDVTKLEDNEGKENKDRYITVNLAEDNDPIAEGSGIYDLIHSYTMDMIREELKKAEAYAVVGDIDYEFADGAVSATINRETDTINHLNYSKAYEVTANIQAKGAFAELNEVKLTFRLTDRVIYDFNWVDPNAEEEA